MTNKKWTTIACAFLAAIFAGAASSEPYFQGVKPCETCHSAEVEVWEGTVHAKSYKTTRKSEKALALLAAVGSEQSMKKDPLCISCHFSLRQKTASSKPKAKDGPSCESCHGPSSDWIDIHNDYGEYASAEEEPPEHKAKRLARAEEAGMIGAFNLFGIAGNCASCHGLSRPDIEGEQLAAMFDHGHPLNAEFELVRYSQGSVRHRFYPPNIDINAELDDSGLARLYVLGKAAQIIAADQAIAIAPAGAYKQAQQAIADAARSALQPVANESAVAAFLAKPTAEQGRALAKSLEDSDLSSLLANQLPAPEDYK